MFLHSLICSIRVQKQNKKKNRQLPIHYYLLGSEYKNVNTTKYRNQIHYDYNLL